MARGTPEAATAINDATSIIIEANARKEGGIVMSTHGT
jgi:hypothetical protein